MLSMIRMHPRPLSSLLCCTLYLVSWSQGNSSRCIIQKRATPTVRSKKSTLYSVETHAYRKEAVKLGLT
jgi:hypothetical protein